MSGIVFSLIVVCSVASSLIVVYRKDIKNWFLCLFYGKEKYEWLKVIRFPQSHVGEWEDRLKDAVHYLLHHKYSFTSKEQENIFKQLDCVDQNKYPWAQSLKRTITQFKQIKSDFKK